VSLAPVKNPIDGTPPTGDGSASFLTVTGYLRGMLPIASARTDSSPLFSDPCHHAPLRGRRDEIKHDGYRLIVRREGATMRLFTRRGFWTIAIRHDERRGRMVSHIAAVGHRSRASPAASGGQRMKQRAE
jgi:hypothetical protein